MDFAYLSSVIREAVEHKHCVLCGTALNSHLDELPCPHWFLAPGWRGFRNRTLARVFELYDLAQVLDYLRIAAASGQSPPWRRREIGGVVEVHIAWGRRDWEFSYEQRDAAPDGTVRRFMLAIRYDGALVDKAQIALAGDGQVSVKPLVQRRRAVAPG